MFFSSCYGDHLELHVLTHSFPTRRSSDLLIGLDVGTKTIGVAFCDTNWSFATPDKTIIRKKFSVDLETLKALIAQHDIVGLVVGLPLNMDGTDSPRTQSTRAFARNLQIGRAHV